jgi:hypothetical protein
MTAKGAATAALETSVTFQTNRADADDQVSQRHPCAGRNRKGGASAPPKRRLKVRFPFARLLRKPSCASSTIPRASHTIPPLLFRGSELQLRHKTTARSAYRSRGSFAGAFVNFKHDSTRKPLRLSSVGARRRTKKKRRAGK